MLRMGLEIFAVPTCMAVTFYVIDVGKDSSFIGRIWVYQY